MNATAARSTAASPELAVPKAILDRLIRAMVDSVVVLPPGVPSPAAPEARLAAGIPALTGEELVSWEDLRSRVRATAEALRSTPASDATETAAAWLDRAGGDFDGAALTAAALAGGWRDIEELTRAHGMDADLVRTLLDYSARPALRAGALVLEPVLAAAAWSRGTCPACGAQPALAVIHGKERERRLCCGRCATTWTFARVRCPACGERGHDRLGSVHAAGQGEYRRADVCETCRCYVKTVALLDLPGADRLLELDLETAGLDFIALEQGYRRPGSEGW